MFNICGTCGKDEHAGCKCVTFTQDQLMTKSLAEAKRISKLRAALKDACHCGLLKPGGICFCCTVLAEDEKENT